MKMTILAALIVAILAALTGYGFAQGPLKSGPQVGEVIPGPFEPLNVTGEFKGEKHCLVCENGTNPVAMVFARDISPELTKLIKEIDVTTAKNKKIEMGSFVVFLSNKEGLAKQLVDLATKEKIEQTALTIDAPAGPEDYNVAKDASITVVLYNQSKVAANHTFRSPSELNDKAIQQVISDVAKIQPKAK